MASARPFHVYTLLDFSLAGFSVLEQHKVQTIGRFFCFPSCSAGQNLCEDTKVAAAAVLQRLFVKNVKLHQQEAESLPRCFGGDGYWLTFFPASCLRPRPHDCVFTCQAFRTNKTETLRDSADGVLV